MTLTSTASFTEWSEEMTALGETRIEGNGADSSQGFSDDPMPPGIPMVYSWGAGEDGQLGVDNNFSDELSPQLVTSLLDKQIVDIVGGSRNSLAISASGQVFLWGWNQRSTLGHSFEEKKLPKEWQPSMALRGVKVVQAAVGGWHVLALNDTGTAFAWGGNEYGQCGKKGDRAQGSSSYRDIRLPITCASHLKIRQVAAGGMHSLVVTEQGEVYFWGQPWPPANNKDGYLPARIAGLSDVAKVAVGAFHNVALLQTGEVLTWGDNEHGQLGSGTTQPKSTPQPVTQMTGRHVVDIAAGGWHTMAVTAEGQLWAWGRGEHGRLGLGEDRASHMTPVHVSTLAHETIVQVACGGTHSVALTKDGRMYAFGRRDNGRIGPLSTATTGHPLRVPLPGDTVFMDEEGYHVGELGPLRVAKVSCGGRHTLALVCYSNELEGNRKGLRWYDAAAKAAVLGSVDDNVVDTSSIGNDAPGDGDAVES